jgi:thioredoxin 1
VTDANFDEVTAEGVALVDFWATWCPPCRAQGPIVERIAGEYRGRATVGKLDVDKNPETAGRFVIQAIPTLIVFTGGDESKRLVGLQRHADLKAALDEALGAR